VWEPCDVPDNALPPRPESPARCHWPVPPGIAIARDRKTGSQIREYPLRTHRMRIPKAPQQSAAKHLQEVATAIFVTVGEPTGLPCAGSIRSAILRASSTRSCHQVNRPFKRDFKLPGSGSGVETVSQELPNAASGRKSSEMTNNSIPETPQRDNDATSRAPPTFRSRAPGTNASPTGDDCDRASARLAHAEGY